MTPTAEDSTRDLLVRIDERVKAIQEDIQAINQARSCASHGVKIKTLERMVWGCLTCLVGVCARIVFTALK